jgi:acyl-CoA dehydrogenase
MSDSGKALREGVEHALAAGLDSGWWNEHGEGAMDAALWASIEELGLPRLMANGEASLAECHGAIAALAALPVPAPAADTMLAHWLAGKANLSLPDGPIAMGPVKDDPLPTLRHGAEGWVLTGRLHDIPWGRHATALLVAASGENGDRWCIVDAGQATIERGKGLSGEPRDLINLHGIAIADDEMAVVPDVGLMWRAGAALRAVQMASALGAMVDLAVTYTTDRVQFGRPLAKFQAIQQQLAVLSALATQSQVAARYAFVVLDGNDAEFAVAAAKSSVGQAASQGVAIAHQSHGAMGFTAEYALHRLTRRVWTWREEFGNEAWWARLIGERCAKNGADALWSTLTHECEALA